MKGDRQRLIFVPSLEHVPFGAWVGGGSVAFWSHFLMYPGAANAAMWPNLMVDRGGSVEVQMGVDHVDDVVLPFRAAPRDRTQAFMHAQWRPSDSVFIDASWSWLHDRLPSGLKSDGPGDLRLGTHAAIWDGPMELGAGWQVKLPNAADEGELGSDETDVAVLATAGTNVGVVNLMAAGGILIQGDPIRFANQDDAGLMWVGLAHEVGSVHLFSQVGGTVNSARNPARMTAEIGASYGCSVQVGGGARKGLTAASEVWGANLWVGFGAGCD